MSRSVKKHPYSNGYVGQRPCRDWFFKQSYHRSFRRNNAMTLKKRFIDIDDYDDLLFYYKKVEYSDLWNANSDGSKVWFGDYKQKRFKYQAINPVCGSVIYVQVTLDNIVELFYEFNKEQYWFDEVYDKLTNSKEPFFSHFSYDEAKYVQYEDELAERLRMYKKSIRK